jgi:hypothetical protein
MGRIRSVHPEQWTDEVFVTCSPLARLLALALRNEADDNGIFEWNAAKMKIRLLPLDNCEVVKLLSELSSTNQVFSYEVDGKRYGIIRSFQRFQNPRKPSFKYPVPAEPLPYGYAFNDMYSPTGAEPVPNEDGKVVPKERRGEEGKKESPKKFDDADLATAEWMYERIEAINPGHKRPNVESWANDIRLMRDRDGREDREIRSLFEWANCDEFWCKNILSPAKLRDKWDRLTLQRKTVVPHPTAHPSDRPIASPL